MASDTGWEGYTPPSLYRAFRELAEQLSPEVVLVNYAYWATLVPGLRPAQAVRLVDMTELGRNPSRIIPAIRDWLDGHGPQPARFVGEPVWPGRSAAEAAESVRHEALLNLAFADTPAFRLVCPYDTGALDAGVIEHARTTHPAVVELTKLSANRSLNRWRKCGIAVAKGGVAH